MSGYDFPMLSTVADVATLVSTRAAFHTLAERVLAPDLQRATGRIGLRRTAGGFGQPEHVVDGHRRRIRVDGTFLVVDRDGDGESWHDITTLGAAAALVGLPPDAETGVFVATSAGDPDAPLAVDPVAAATIAEWFRFVDTATKCFDTAALPSASVSQRRAAVALVRVSRVENVLDATMKSVVAGSNPSSLATRSAGSTLETNRAEMPASA